MAVDVSLKLEYRELAVIRKLVLDKRYSLWLAFSRNIKEEYKNDFDVLTRTKTRFDNARNPFDKNGLLGRIEDKIEKIELNYQKSIKREVS